MNNNLIEILETEEQSVTLLYNFSESHLHFDGLNHIVNGGTPLTGNFI